MKFTGSWNTKLAEAVSPEHMSLFPANYEQIAFDGDVKFFEQNELRVFFTGQVYNQERLSSNSIDLNPAQLIFDLYTKEGPSGFKLLDGEFCFFIWKKDEILAYRDRHGAGEQIYFTDQIFASHQYLLKGFKKFEAVPDFETMALFLQIGYIPSPQTALKDVQKLPAGQLLSFKNKKISLTELYGYEDFNTPNEKLKISVEDATTEYERLHKQAINDRIKNSDQVQLLLSGGYDSGGNISTLRDVYSGAVSSYSIGFKDNEWTELPLAKKLSEVFNTDHFEYEIDGSEIEALPDIIKQLGDPFNENGVMVNFAAMRLVKAKNGKGVILGGDGNDQHFGTAGKELAMNFKYRSNGMAVFQKMVSAFSDMSPFEKDGMLFKVRFHNEKVLHILESDNFGFRKSQISKIFKNTPVQRKPLYLKKLPTDSKGFDEFYNVHNYFGDIKQVINEVILFKASKMAANFDGQMSFPYMSTDLYNFLKQLPRDLKLKGSLAECAGGSGKSKFLHKNYLNPKLPKEITERKKQGGFAPLPIFLQDTKRFDIIAEKILTSSLTKEHLNKSYIEKILNQYRSEKDTNPNWFWYRQVKAFQIINLLTLTTWWKTMIEN